MAHFNGRIPPQQHNYGFDAPPAPQQHQQPAPAQGRDYGPNPMMRGVMRGVSSFLNYRTQVSLSNLDYCQKLHEQGAGQAPFQGFSQHFQDAGGPAPQHHHHDPAHHHAPGWHGGAAAPGAAAPLAPGVEAEMRSTIDGLKTQIQQMSQDFARSLAAIAAQLEGQAPESRPTRDRVNDLHRQQSRRDHAEPPAPAPQAEDAAAQAMNLLDSRPTVRPERTGSHASSTTADDDYQNPDQDRDDGRDSAGRSRQIIDDQQLPSGSSNPGAAAGASTATDNTFGADGAHDLLSNAKAQTNLQREGRDQGVHLTR